MKSKISEFIKKETKKLTQKEVIIGEDLFLTVNQDFTDFSIDGVCEDKECSILRPLRRFFDNKRPIGRLYCIFYRNKEKNRYHILGTLCHTHYAKKNSRLIFFPGLTGRNLGWATNANSSHFVGRLDHFTIESDEKSWHYTLIKNSGKKEKNRLPDNKIKEVIPGIFSWFSMNIKNENLLEVLHRRYTFKVEANESNYDELLKTIRESKENIVHQVVEQPLEDANKSEFIHIEFFLDRRKQKNNKGIFKICNVPRTKPALKKDLENIPPTFPIRAHSVKIDTFDDIFIVVSKHTGKLSEDCIIGGHAVK